MRARRERRLGRTTRLRWRRVALGSAVSLLVALVGLACGSPDDLVADPEESAEGRRPHLVLVTLDTTRDDALRRPDTPTPQLDRLRREGIDFVRAYSTVPETLPAHASMLTGAYPWEMQLHENGRRLGDDLETLPETLGEYGYRTAAFVSGFPLLARFGLARGFVHYDDEVGEVERSAADTNAAVRRYLDENAVRSNEPLFLWLHYFDPHDPYEPPEEFLAMAPDPYLAEIAALDARIGELIAMLDQRLGEYRLLVVADHGEGRGDHGEMLHGNLLSEGVMRVPMIAWGTGIEPAVEETPVSVREVRSTFIEWATSDAIERGDFGSVVRAEAMKPYLQYGWQPQVMVVDGALKAIRDSEVRVFDVVTDPAEESILSTDGLSPAARQALREIPVPQPADTEAPAISEGDRQRLESLGYATFEHAAAARADAPDPRAMTHLFLPLDLASRFFSEGRYDEARRELLRIAREDPENPSVLLRLAVANSLLGDASAADRWFGRAEERQPSSIDVLLYRALHELRSGRRAEARRRLEAVLEASPNRLTALDALASIYEVEGEWSRAVTLLRNATQIERESPDLHRRLGSAAMAIGDSDTAIAAFEAARSLDSSQFEADLELGVLYLAQHRYAEARDALDRIAPDHPRWPMVLFKRAQVSVLLREPDAARRVAAAREAADAETASLVARENLFREF